MRGKVLQYAGAFWVTRPLESLGNKCYYLRNGTRQRYSYNGRLIGNHMSYRTAPSSMTFSDPECDCACFTHF